MADEIVGGASTAWYKRALVAAGAGGVAVVVTNAAVESWLEAEEPETVSGQTDAQRQEALDEAENAVEWKRGLLQIGLGLVGGRVVMRWSKDAGVGIAVGCGAMGAYRILDGIGFTDTVSDWFAPSEERPASGVRVRVRHDDEGQRFEWDERRENLRERRAAA